MERRDDAAGVAIGSVRCFHINYIGIGPSLMPSVNAKKPAGPAASLASASSEPSCSRTWLPKRRRRFTSASSGICRRRSWSASGRRGWCCPTKRHCSGIRHRRRHRSAGDGRPRRRRVAVPPTQDRDGGDRPCAASFLRFFFQYFRLQSRRWQPREIDQPVPDSGGTTRGGGGGRAAADRDGGRDRHSPHPHADGHPVMHDRLRLAEERVPGLPRDPEALPPLLYLHLLERYGIRISAVREQITADLASDEDMALLDLPGARLSSPSTRSPMTRPACPPSSGGTARPRRHMPM